MKKQYTITLTASEAFYLEIALGGQIIKDCKERSETTDTERSDTLGDRLGVARDLAGTIGNLTNLIVEEYEDGMVAEFVTNMDKGLEDF
jgi:hypothetical protein